MSNRCEQLRRNALRDGLDSRAGLAWRVHCRSCEECRTELYILETLQRQARDERAHLGREELDSLMQQVRQVQNVRRRGSRLKRVTLQLAALAAVFIFLAMLPGGLSSGNSGRDGGKFLRTPAAGAPADTPVILAGNTARGALEKGETRGARQPRLDGTCERRIIELRRRLNHRRELLRKKIEHELGGDIDDQGAYDAASAALACALV